MTDKNEKELEEIMNLEAAMIERLMALSPDQLVAELQEDGINPETEAQEVRQIGLLAIGRAKMAAAKEAVSLQKHRNLAAATTLKTRPANDVEQARGLTLAARNGSEQSDADVKSVAEDLALLASIKAQEPKDE